MDGKPAPSSHEPPLQAEGISELNAKLREKGLMAWRSLSSYTPSPEAPTHAEQVRNLQRQETIKATNAAKRHNHPAPTAHKHC